MGKFSKAMRVWRRLPRGVKRKIKRRGKKLVGRGKR
jgi:hypothetical protein